MAASPTAACAETSAGATAIAPILPSPVAKSHANALVEAALRRSPRRALGYGVRFQQTEVAVSHARTHNFAVLSTIDDGGRPRSTGVNYGVSPPGSALAIYVMTRRHLQKARNIALDPNVALVVPLRRQLLWFLPPATIQLSGVAEILDLE